MIATARRTAEYPANPHACPDRRISPGLRDLDRARRRGVHLLAANVRTRTRTASPSLAGRRRPGGESEMGAMMTGRAAGRPAGPRVLVVDDEPEVGGLVERVLVADGYVVGRAGDGKDGLRQALDGSWGLIILDLIMPEMSGSEMLARLRLDRPDQPVLILSCVSDVLTKVHCLDLGAQDYLTKPFQLAELLARVRVRLRDDHPRDDGHLKDEVVQVGELSLDVGRLQADAGSGPVPLPRLGFLFR